MLIYLDETPYHTLKSDSHLINFTKYLFSQSNSHQPNDFTCMNWFVSNGRPQFIGVTPKDQLSSFLALMKSKPYSRYINSLNYPLYVFRNGKTLITNIFTLSQDENVLSIWDHIHLTDEQLQEVLDFAKNEEFDRTIELHEVTDSVLLFSLEDAIHQKAHFTNRENDLEKQFNLLISISHHDQDEYHIHRLLAC